MVSIEDFAFVVFSFIYMYFISPLSPDVVPSLFGEKNRILGLYVFIGAMISLLLPISYIFKGICEGDTEGIKATVSDVFLLASQVFMEGVAFSDQFSLSIRVYVLVIYNSVRIFTIMDWLRTEISKVDQGYAGSVRRLYIGRTLAVANLVFWCFNLFGFLLPVYLPKTFKAYYSSAGLKVKRLITNNQANSHYDFLLFFTRIQVHLPSTQLKCRREYYKSVIIFNVIIY